MSQTMSQSELNTSRSRPLQIRVTRGPGAGRVYDVSAAGQYVFGKSQAARHQLADRSAERVQFTLTSQSWPRGLELSDPDSLRGVLVNGVVRRRATLASGDRIYFGATELLVCPQLPPRRQKRHAKAWLA